MHETFETVPCDLCGAEETEVLLRGHDQLAGLPGEFQFVRCLECGLVRQNPRPTVTAVAQFYPESYPSFALSAQVQGSKLRRAYYRYGQLRRVRLVKRYLDAGRLLDVGCGAGDFLSEISNTGGWQALGIEPSFYACSHARQALGVKVVCGFLSQAPLAPQSYDVVTMWNALEHVHDPTRNLLEAHRVLRPGGLLILSVPIMDSLLRERFGSHWVEWDLPRHMFVFSQYTLRNLLQKTGFRLLDARPVSSEYRVFQMSLTNKLNEKSFSDRTRRVVVSLSRFMPVRLLGALALGALVPAQRHSVLAFVCQRD